MEIMAEADRNDVTQCAYHDHPYAATCMSGVPDYILCIYLSVYDMYDDKTSTAMFKFLCIQTSTTTEARGPEGQFSCCGIHKRCMTSTFGWLICYMHCSECKQVVRPLCMAEIADE